MVSFTCSSFSLGEGYGPGEAIWRTDEKQAKLLVNLASEKEIGRESRKAITSERQITPYANLVQLLGKILTNLFIPQLIGLLKVLSHH